MPGLRHRRLTCPPDKVLPGSWIAGEVVSFDGSWWLIEEMYRDTQGSSGTHFTLVEAHPTSRPIQTFERADDPEWKIGEAVEAPNGKDMIVTGANETTGLLTYVGVDVPPPDPPELTALFGV